MYWLMNNWMLILTVDNNLFGYTTKYGKEKYYDIQIGW